MPFCPGSLRRVTVLLLLQTISAYPIIKTMSAGTLAIGTTNPGKVDAVRRATSLHSEFAGWTMTPFSVPSGVADQPMSRPETLQGAKNRARRAWEAATAATGGAIQSTGASEQQTRVLAVGLESGLFKEDSDGDLFDVCACAVFDGANYHVGYSCAWKLPREIADVKLLLFRSTNHDFNCNPRTSTFLAAWT